MLSYTILYEISIIYRIIEFQNIEIYDGGIK